MEMIQAHAGDALWLLRERYAPLLTTIGGAVLHNDAEVQDLLQEVFVEIWNRAGRYESAKGRPVGWIVTLTRRRAIDRLRRREAYGRAGDRLAAEIDGQNDSWTHVYEDIARHEMAERLEQALTYLPEAQRTTIHFMYYRQMSQREIAAHTGTPLGTVKTRLELGMKKMAVLLCGFEDLLATGKRAVTSPIANVTPYRRSRHRADNVAMNTATDTRCPPRICFRDALGMSSRVTHRLDLCGH